MSWVRHIYEAEVRREGEGEPHHVRLLVAHKVRFVDKRRAGKRCGTFSFPRNVRNFERNLVWPMERAIS